MKHKACHSYDIREIAVVLRNPSIDYEAANSKATNRLLQSTIVY